MDENFDDNYIWKIFFDLNDLNNNVLENTNSFDNNDLITHFLKDYINNKV